ncbi:MAG TPA: hypothetical protein VKS82_16515 [Streptosporangiaceae bacterium]|nr:hypothetical protein [Streptosporangiaceae bacterium]
MTAMEHTETSNPAAAVVAGVQRILELAQTWLAWDGTPHLAGDGVRIYTPAKAIRRHADHLIDHLAEIEALLAGQETEPDEWHASNVTLASDWASFTEADLNEARQRLRRLAQAYLHRLAVAGRPEWDAPRGSHWTIREITEHVAGAWYAEQVGDLSKR